MVDQDGSAGSTSLQLSLSPHVIFCPPSLCFFPCMSSDSNFSAPQRHKPFTPDATISMVFSGCHQHTAAWPGGVSRHPRQWAQSVCPAAKPCDLACLDKYYAMHDKELPGSRSNSDSASCESEAESNGLGTAKEQRCNLELKAFTSEGEQLEARVANLSNNHLQMCSHRMLQTALKRAMMPSAPSSIVIAERVSGLCVPFFKSAITPNGL